MSTKRLFNRTRFFLVILLAIAFFGVSCASANYSLGGVIYNDQGQVVGFEDTVPFSFFASVSSTLGGITYNSDGQITKMEGDNFSNQTIKS